MPPLPNPPSPAQCGPLHTGLDPAPHGGFTPPRRGYSRTVSNTEPGAPLVATATSTHEHDTSTQDATQGESPTVRDLSALDRYKIHPAAELFPIFDHAALFDLAEDIAANGQAEPILMFEGQVLDGRNRILACDMAGVKPRFQDWLPRLGEDPYTYVMSRNLHRRHLTASQRATVAVELERILARNAQARRKQEQAASATTVRFTSPGKPTQPRLGEQVASPRARDQAAAAAHVSAGYVNDAKNLEAESPELFAKVRSGEMTLVQAQTAVVREAMDAGRVGDLKLRPGTVRDIQARIEKERAAAAPKPAAPTRRMKASKVQSSSQSFSMTVTFSNEDVAVEYLERLQSDRRVLDLTYTQLERRPVSRGKGGRATA